MSTADTALYEQGRRTQAKLDRAEAVANLRALGVPEPELRWGAVRDYLAEQRAAYTAAVNRVLVLATAMDFAEENAHRRGGSGILLRDVFAACARVQEHFGAKLGPRAAAYVAEKFIPAELRT